MLDLLWMVPAFPLAGFLILAIVGRRLAHGVTTAIGVGSVGVSALLALSVGAGFIWFPPLGNSYTQTLWTWINLPHFAPKIGLYLDALSLVMVLVVTIVGVLIHVYSTEYMADDEDYSRFFAYMNLFVAAMLTLVLADNLVLLYVGWEGVGLCSYFLIGFWYKEASNAAAAVKAFVMTRIGDTAMAVGIFLLFTNLGSLEIQDLLQRASQQWAPGTRMAVLAAGLLLCGAVGKSAQLPLQTWLPDAMAGPTPVSALIHAATMVTAGVYLIARTNVLFTLAPQVQSAVAIIGVATLVLAACSALAQSDIKRMLAYSTISQIGYMFLALGVGAWSAAIFHFFTHAWFKALLFLAAGSIIICARHEQNMFKMGGLRNQLPVTFWTFFVGAASLSALPLVTAGYYSKEMILQYAWSSHQGGPWLWAGGVLGALLTGIYAFRGVFLVFFGEARTTVTHRPGLAVTVPLIIFAVASVAAGFVQWPENMANMQLFSGLLKTALPSTVTAAADHVGDLARELGTAAACIAGIVIAYLFFVKHQEWPEALAGKRISGSLNRFWLAGWGFDRLYNRLFVSPFVFAARTNSGDFIDLFYRLGALLTEAFHYCLSFTQTGNVRQYALGILAGAVATIAIVVFL
jgi:NADH-quinone oxidoreductase subunit L